MSKKTTPRQKLKEYGYAGAYQTSLDGDKFILDFKVDAGFAYGFSEITLLNYIAESYRSSTLTLLQEVSKIVNLDDSQVTHSHKVVEKYSHGFVPAMFCFRHYLELKLKALYMTINKRQFNNNFHDLTNLFGEIEGEMRMLCIDSAGIENAVRYVELHEKSNPHHFRYFIDKDFESTEQIIMSYKTILDEIKKLISDFSRCCFEIEKAIACANLKLIKKVGGVWKPTVHGEMTFEKICGEINNKDVEK